MHLKVTNLVHPKRFLALVCAFFATSTATAQHYSAVNGDYQSAQSYYPTGDIETRNSQPALGNLQPGQLPGATRTNLVQLWPATISYAAETKFMNPTIAPDLSFGINYSYSFTFNLGAKKINGEAAEIPNGWYKLNLAVVLTDADNIFRRSLKIQSESPYDRFVTSTSLLVNVTSGRLTRTITLSFPNVTATTLKNHLFVEFIPLKKDCKVGNKTVSCIAVQADGRMTPDLSRSVVEPLSGVQPYLVEMPFVPLQQAGRYDRSPDYDASSMLQPLTQQSLSQYISTARLYQQRKLWSRYGAVEPKEYAKATHLEYFNRDQIQNRKAIELINRIFAAEGIGTITLSDEDKKVLPVFCNLLMENNRQFQATLVGYSKTYRDRIFNGHAQLCARHPERYLALSRVTHIAKLDGQKPPKSIFTRSMSFNLMANFMVARTRSEDLSQNISIKPQSLLFGGLEAFGIVFPEPVTWTENLSVTNGRSSSESMLGTMVSNLDFNVNAMNLTAAHAVQCLHVVALPPDKPLFFDQPGFSPFYDSRPNADHGLYICGDEQRNLNVQELYAHVFERGKETSTVDAFEANSQSANFSLRGDRDIAAFFYSIRSNITPKHDSKIFPFKILEKAGQYLASRPVSHNKLVVQPLTFAKDETPSFVDKVFGLYSESFVGSQ